ncbi:MAG TPA: amidase [Candidatus Lustribacter sp.]|nr:amidase [Candidatus Lustribacter sp.]
MTLDTDIARFAGAPDASSRELVESCLNRASDPNGTGAVTFIRRFDEQARALAASSDRMRRGGAPLLPLSGVPVSVKDLFDIAGSVTTAGSFVLRDAPPASQDAPAVARLRAAGAIIVGATNMTEFAFGSTGINAKYGTPPNPYDRASARIPGGSSSGAAISVCDDFAVAAVGSDTACSVRAPAAYCGIVGFKPTASRIPLAGAIPLAGSLDSIGPLAASVANCAVMDAVLAADDPAPPTAFPLAGLRLAIPSTVVLDELEADVAAGFERTVGLLAKNGAVIGEIALPELAEILERGLAQRFTLCEGYAWHRELLETKRDLYDPAIAGRLLEGAGISAAEYIDALTARKRLIATSRRITGAYDAVIMPTLAITARRIADVQADRAYAGETARLSIRNANIANVLDRCALTIPCHEPGKAPVGFTLMGETLSDRKILAIGLSVEAVVKGAFR